MIFFDDLVVVLGFFLIFFFLQTENFHFNKILVVIDILPECCSSIHAKKLKNLQKHIPLTRGEETEEKNEITLLTIKNINGKVYPNLNSLKKYLRGLHDCKRFVVKLVAKNEMSIVIKD